MAQALLATVLAVITAVGANSLTRQAIHSLQEIHPAWSEGLRSDPIKESFQ